MKKIQIGARIKNAWEYKRTALLWTVLIVLVFLVLSLLFLRFADAMRRMTITTAMTAMVAARAMITVIFALSSVKFLTPPKTSG